jgi:hypothetical protein
MGLSFLVAGFGLFGLLAFSATDAHAGCPPPTGTRYIGGTCFTVKGVEVDAQVNHTGNLQRNQKKLTADITVTGGTFGIVFCKNKAGKQPPGQVLAPIPTTETFSCFTKVNPQDVFSSQNGGTAQVGCTALVADLSIYDPACSTGQHAVDFVPIQFLAGVTYSDLTGTDVIEFDGFTCELPDFQTLKWDRTTDLPEKREYNCVGPQ